MSEEKDQNLLVVTKRYSLINTYGHSLMAVGNCYVTDSIREIRDILKKYKVTLALVDVDQGNSQGFEALEELCNNHPEVSTIAVISQYDYDKAISAMKAGADDFLTEPLNVTELEEFFHGKQPISKQKPDGHNLLPGIVHDFNNSIHRIIIYSKMLKLNRKEGLDASAFNQLLDNLVKAGRSTSSMLNDILHWTNNLSELTRFQLSPVQLNQLVYDCHEEFENVIRKQRISFITNISDDIIVQIDKHMIRFVIRNLIENAIKFTSEQDKIEICAIEKNNYVILVVSDTGEGIDVDTLNALRKGNTLPKSDNKLNHKRGNGTGLSICRKYLAQHGSDLHIVSEVGKGSCFYFYLNKV